MWNKKYYFNRTGFYGRWYVFKFGTLEIDFRLLKSWNINSENSKFEEENKKKRFTGNENHFATFPMVWIKKTGL